MKSPIFLFSSPRAGSTLLQRILLAHPKIGGTAEPWLMLPFLYATKNDGTFSEYSHISSSKALNDFISNLPDKNDTYYKYLSEFGSKLYAEQLQNNEVYFLDKTPRYYLIIQEIVKLYPDAKYIFLFRNPLDILSSIVNTWNKGKMRLHSNYIDLYLGPSKLAEGYEQIKNRSIAINYEDLIIDPESTIKKVCEYLDLQYKPEILNDFKNVKLSGRMGDKTGRYLYDKVDSSSLNKWHITLSTIRRIAYAKKYINKLGSDVLRIHGYDKENILAELSKIKPKKTGFISDNFNLFLGFLLRHIEYSQLRRRIKNNKKLPKKTFFQHM